MKKLLLLLILPLMLGCSTETNEPSTNESDPIIGTWKVIKMTEYPSNAEPVVTNFDECYQRGRSTFHADGTSEGKGYRYNSEGECVVQEFINQTMLSSTWQKITETKYRFTQESIAFGNRRVDSSTPESVMFPDSNTMEIMQMGTNRQYNDPIDVEYYVHTYQRVN